MKYITTILVFIICNGHHAQGVLPSDWGLKAYQIHDPKLGEINYYVTEKGIVEELSPMKNLEEYKPSERYIENCGLEWEIAASIVTIDAMRTHLTNSSNTTIALGISEGGQLVPCWNSFAWAKPT